MRPSQIICSSSHTFRPTVSALSLEIIQYPHPTLRHLSKPIKKVDAELRAMVAEMFELMYQHEGVGLAANQVNLPYRLFVTNEEGDRQIIEAERVFINPVLSKGRGQVEQEEGCLSIPDVRAPVVRKESIHVQAYDLQGNEIEGDVDGFLARILQHETDHLDGTLFIDRLRAAQLADIKDSLYEFELNFRSRRETGELSSDEEIVARLKELERLRT
jgi:peptide deformylase